MPALMKILQYKYLEALLNGDLHMKSADFFRQCDKSDAVRSDEHKGLHSCIQYEKLEVNKGDGWRLVSVKGQALLRTEESATFNMFCLYGINFEHAAPLDSRCFGFGDTFVVITEPDEFTRRVGVAAEKIQKVPVLMPVEYVDRATYHGGMGPFRKFSNFDYQQEMRLVIFDVGNGVFTLSIGDIGDIRLHGSLEEFDRRLIRLAATPD